MEAQIKKKLVDEGIIQLMDNAMELDGRDDVESMRLELEMKCSAYLIEATHRHVSKQHELEKHVMEAVKTGYNLLDVNQTESEKHVTLLGETLQKKIDEYNSTVQEAHSLKLDLSRHKEAMELMGRQKQAAHEDYKHYELIRPEVEKKLQLWNDYTRLLIQMREKQAELDTLQQSDSQLAIRIDELIHEKEDLDSKIQVRRAAKQQKEEEEEEMEREREREMRMRQKKLEEKQREMELKNEMERQRQKELEEKQCEMEREVELAKEKELERLREEELEREKKAMEEDPVPAKKKKKATPKKSTPMKPAARKATPKKPTPKKRTSSEPVPPKKDDDDDDEDLDKTRDTADTETFWDLW